MITRLRSRLPFRARSALLPVFNFFRDLRDFVGTRFLACWCHYGFALGVQAGTYNDNALVFGSQVITTVTGAVSYIGEDIDVTAGSKRIETTDQNGVANKQAFMDEVPNGSATLQLATLTTVPPSRYDTFSLVPVGGGTAVFFVISEVGQKFQAAGETKVSIKMYLQLSKSGQSAQQEPA